MSTATLSATEYLQSITSSMLGIQVTDAAGERLFLDEGGRRAVELLLTTRHERRKVLLVGNGGSAAIVSHMHNDLTKGSRIRSLVFQDVPLLTALSNDDGYESALEFSVRHWGEPGDLLVAVSSSGESTNIQRAVSAAIARDCRVVTLSGFQPSNALRKRGDLNFYVASSHYGYVEIAHAAVCHFLTDCCVAPPGAAAP